MTIHLVACCKEKLDASAPARELYASSLFRKTRRVVEATGERWFILSAGLGLVHPDTMIPPYDTTLADFDAAEHRCWAKAAAARLHRYLDKTPHRILMWAGLRYRHPLTAELVKLGHKVEAPLAGLGIGQQLQRLTEMARVPA